MASETKQASPWARMAAVVAGPGRLGATELWEQDGTESTKI